MIRHYCRRCELKWYETDGGSGHVHDYTYRTDTVYPTCIKAGYTEHFCACGESYRDGYTAALGHNLRQRRLLTLRERRGHLRRRRRLPEQALITTWTPGAGTTRASTTPLRTA